MRGYAEGVLLKHLMGRPVKVEGNPVHPASLGAASAIMQASILSLYDPRRAQSITGGGQLQSWHDFVAALYARRQVLLRGRRKRPAGDDRHRDLADLRGADRRPAAAVSGDAAGVHWEPLDRDTERGADAQAFRPRRRSRVRSRAQAQIVFGVESDLISTAPGALAYARQFAGSRRPYETGGGMSRVYAIESTPTLLGAKADHRLALSPAEIAIALRYIAGAVGAGPREWTQLETGRASWLAAAAEDLSAHRGRVLVHAGSGQPEDVHLLVQCDQQRARGLRGHDQADRPGCGLTAAPRRNRSPS